MDVTNYIPIYQSLEPVEAEVRSEARWEVPSEAQWEVRSEARWEVPSESRWAHPRSELFLDT